MTSDLRDKAMALRRAMFEAREERDRALLAIERVRELHQQYRTSLTDEFDVCTECTTGVELVPWPCATVRALVGAAAPEEANDG